MNRLQEIADNWYGGQRYATVEDYGSDANAYADDLVDLATANGWDEGLTDSEVEDIHARIVKLAERDLATS